MPHVACVRPRGAPRLKQGYRSATCAPIRASSGAAPIVPRGCSLITTSANSLPTLGASGGPLALETSDFTARVDVTGLPNDSGIFVRVRFQDPSNNHVVSDPVRGSFRTAPVKNRAIRFLSSGDTAGQGWGINPDVGGMTIYEAMRQTRPDFFIHCGDTIYADGPIQESVIAEKGREWKNIVTPEVSKVAETLAEFRGRYKYNLLDEHVRRFNAEVPQIWQWDDHEVLNNWSATKDLSTDARYREKHLPLLIARSARAFTRVRAPALHRCGSARTDLSLYPLRSALGRVRA